MFSSISITEVWEFISSLCGVLAVLSVLVEFTPIKVHPLSKVGAILTKDLKKEVTELKKDVGDINTKLKNTEDNLTDKIESTQKLSTERYIKQLRGEILDFSNSCMNKREHTQDEFEHIIDAHDEYERLIEELGMTNGRVALEFKYISEIYQKCKKENSFL